MRRRTTILLLILPLFAVPQVRAQEGLPLVLQGVGFDQRLDEQVPLDAMFRDEAGRSVRFGDYLGDTGHLTTTQHGAYLLLMMHYWRKGELPDDDRQLAKITKLSLKSWCAYRVVLQGFFHSGWKHKRIDAELERLLPEKTRQRVLIQGADHGMWLQQPAACRQAVLEFIKAKG